jgi:hypothetical protein
MKTGLEVDAEKNKCTFLLGEQNVKQSHNLKTENESFERFGHLKYMGTNLMDKNSINGEIKSRLVSGNAN